MNVFHFDFRFNHLANFVCQILLCVFFKISLSNKSLLHDHGRIHAHTWVFGYIFLNVDKKDEPGEREKGTDHISRHMLDIITGHFLYARLNQSWSGKSDIKKLNDV